jgi:hypothetical protein
MEFVIDELLEDSLAALEVSGKSGFEWMRTVDTRFLTIQHLVETRKLQPILLHKIVFLMIKASAIKNLYVHMLSLGIFETLMNLLSDSRSPLLYILIAHIIINPLQ